MLSARERGKSISRRQLMVGGATLAAGSAALFATTGSRLAASTSAIKEVVAKAQITELRRLYGKATDLLGAGKDHENICGNSEALARQIYQRIFTEDATIDASGGALTGVGPDDWADKVAGALASFSATQHMLGTQLVDIHEMPVDGSSGDATMQSYLNALHEFAPQGTILIVRGTYFDKARHSPENGWQIYDMNLVYVSIETREHTPPAPPEEESTEEEASEEESGGEGEGNGEG